MTTTKKTTPKTTANAAPAPKLVEVAVAASKENVVKVSTKAATKGVEQAVAASQEHVAVAVKAGTDAFKGYEEVFSFAKANVDAVVKANELLVKGMQNLNKEIFAIAQATLEGNADVTKKVLSCTSVQDAVAMQNDLVKANYEKAMTEGRKITDMTVELAQEAAAPITKRVNVTVEKFTKELAA